MIKSLLQILRVSSSSRSMEGGNLALRRALTRARVQLYQAEEKVINLALRIAFHNGTHDNLQDDTDLQQNGWITINARRCLKWLYTDKDTLLARLEESRRTLAEARLHLAQLERTCRAEPIRFSGSI